MTTENKTCFQHGMRDGCPIALGYFAVSFTLGIAAKNAGLSAIQAFAASVLNNASAGEYAGFSLIAARRHLSGNGDNDFNSQRKISADVLFSQPKAET